MRTALDTNVVSALLGGEKMSAAVAAALLEASRRGSLMLPGPAYAETLVNPNLAPKELDDILAQLGIRVDAFGDLALWKQSGEAFRAYAERRRASAGGLPRRILADFLIGAHATLRADRLMTLDPAHHRLAFPDLTLVVPGAP